MIAPLQCSQPQHFCDESIRDKRRIEQIEADQMLDAQAPMRSRLMRYREQHQSGQPSTIISRHETSRSVAAATGGAARESQPLSGRDRQSPEASKHNGLGKISFDERADGHRGHQKRIRLAPVYGVDLGQSVICCIGPQGVR